jgi:hypothetical protein
MGHNVKAHLAGWSAMRAWLRAAPAPAFAALTLGLLLVGTTAFLPAKATLYLAAMVAVLPLGETLGRANARRLFRKWGVLRCCECARLMLPALFEGLGFCPRCGGRRAAPLARSPAWRR